MTNTRSAPDDALHPALHPALFSVMLHRRPKPVDGVALALWETLYPNLVVIIGNEGFNALYDRSFHETSLTFPWLIQSDAAPSASRFERLKSALENRQAEEADHATVLLLSTFTSVLNTLIGRQLTHTIMATAWGTAFEEANQEISTWPRR